MLGVATKYLKAVTVTCLLLVLAACGTSNTTTVLPVLSITTAALPSGAVGVAYGASIAAASGTTPYTFSTASTLPPGLTFQSAGSLAGTPSAAGSYPITVVVTDAANVHATANYTVAIAAGTPVPLRITTTTLPAGTVNVAYSSTIAATGGTGPYSFKIGSGTAPAGLTLSAAGVLSGTPTSAGSSSLTVTVTDAANNSASATYSVVIAAVSTTLTLGPTALPSGLVGTAYSTTLQASGGTAPYTFTQTGGTLPASFTVSSAGVLAGTPTAAGTFTFTVKAVDSSNPQVSGSTSYTLVIVNATVTVNTSSVLNTVPQTFFGLHTSIYDTNLNDVSRLPGLLSTTGITTLRYPGGSYSDRYHWAQFSLTPEYASTPPACQQEISGFLGLNADFGNFIRTVIATGTQALITVNYGTSVANSGATLSSGTTGVLNRCSEPNTAGQPQEAAAWVAYANGLPTNTQSIGIDAVGFDWKTVGFWAGLRAASPLPTDDGYNFLRLAHPAPIGILHWEIGNEMYYNGWSHNLNPETDLHAPYIYPNGYAGGTFNSRESNPLLSPTAYGTNAAAWVSAMKAVDPTILIGVDFASPGATDPIPLNWNPDLSTAVCGATSIDLAIIHYYPGTYNAVMPGELLSLPQSDLPRQVAGIQANLKANCTNASAIKFWLTETSPNGTLAPNFPTPVIGLFTLNEFLISLQIGISNIDWLELHNGTYLDESENPGPSYFGIQLAHLLAGIGDSIVSTTSSSSTLISYATVKTDGRKGVLLINADPANSSSVQVTFGGSVTLGATATQYSFGVNTTQSGTVLNGSSVSIPGNTFNVTVPPYTATELLIP